LPIATYLRQIQGLKYKSVGLFSTTAAPLAVEWYFLYGYLLDLTFSRIINKKEGKFKTSIMLSSIFKKWSVDSN